MPRPNYLKILSFNVLFAVSIFFIGCSPDEGRTDKTLKFKELDFFTGNSFYSATGMTSNADGTKLYFASRETQNTDYTERIIEYDVATRTKREFHHIQLDYITKELNILDDELVVVSGLHVNFYPLNQLSTPESHEHGMRLSRHGSTVYNGEVYAWGGDLDAANSDKIWKWNRTNNSFDEVGSLPEPRTWAGGDILDGYLFVFGGREQFDDQLMKNTIYQYDLENNTVITHLLPYVVMRSYAQAYEGTIYTGFHLLGEDFKAFTILGTFDPTTGEYDQRLFTIENEVEVGNIHQMHIVKDKMYILYGNSEQDGLSLQVARL